MHDILKEQLKRLKQTQRKLLQRKIILKLRKKKEKRVKAIMRTALAIYAMDDF